MNVDINNSQKRPWVEHQNSVNQGVQASSTGPSPKRKAVGYSIVRRTKVKRAAATTDNVGSVLPASDVSTAETQPLGPPSINTMYNCVSVGNPKNSMNQLPVGSNTAITTSIKPSMPPNTNTPQRATSGAQPLVTAAHGGSKSYANQASGRATVAQPSSQALDKSCERGTKSKHHPDRSPGDKHDSKTCPYLCGFTASNVNGIVQHMVTCGQRKKGLYSRKCLERPSHWP